MKTFFNAMFRSLGYEVRRIETPVSAAMKRFANSTATEPEFDVGLDSIDARSRNDRPLDLDRASDPAGPARTLIVEGWRFIPHSYALVNQWQLLALSRRQDVAVKFVDVPFFGPRWQTQEGLFEPKAEQALHAIETTDPDDSADVTLRMFFPYDFAPSRSRLTAVFGTSESQVILRKQLADFRAYERLKRTPPPENVKAITPSRWSAEGFYKAGFKTDQVLIVPHGVDIDTFHPMPSRRSHVRRRISMADDAFVFLSVGAMTGNKGMDLLLQAFCEVSRRFPHARLVLKGMDPLYNSMNFLAKTIEKVPQRDQQRVLQKITYFGKSFSHDKMAMLYQVADTYVSPYRAEGFNMPVLEAAASGIPIICTNGGATDDFTTDAFARRIESKKYLIRNEDQQVSQLEPSVEHLIALMVSAIEDASWRTRAAAAGPLHVAENYTWDRVVDTLIKKLSD